MLSPVWFQYSIFNLISLSFFFIRKTVNNFLVLFVLLLLPLSSIGSDFDLCQIHIFEKNKLNGTFWVLLKQKRNNEIIIDCKLFQILLLLCSSGVCFGYSEILDFHSIFFFSFSSRFSILFASHFLDSFFYFFFEPSEFGYFLATKSYFCHLILSVRLRTRLF